MICVLVDADGLLRPLDPQPEDISVCTMVIPSGESFLANPFVLTIEQGAQIGGAIALLWVTAGCFRVVRQYL